MSKIATCIVTFNRAPLLLRALQQVISQSVTSDHIFIFNNASTDDTILVLAEFFSSPFESLKPLNQLISIPNDGTKIWLFNSDTNSGGAGGFHDVVKLAHTHVDPDYFWMMDDDGYPDGNCLSLLLNHAQLNQSDYIMPTSIDIEQHSQLSWSTRMQDGEKTLNYEELKTSWGEVMDFVIPFNGVLLSRQCIEQVGYVNKDFFIWGDDYEHVWRCKEKGINPYTLMDAKFYHPALKLPLVPILFGAFHVPYTPSKLRMYCLVRNSTYLHKHYDGKWKIIPKALVYTWFFIFSRRFDLTGLKLYYTALVDGLKENFTKHRDYLNK